ncbi:hypothetical protein ACFWGI_35565 [Streptomyces niveus]|uniref:hypothetical protein n=1 Tax=Streptomyces niveus TaxID=193462 RepID=UPI003663882F
MAQVTAHDALTYSLKRERRVQFSEGAERLAKQAARRAVAGVDQPASGLWVAPP